MKGVSCIVLFSLSGGYLIGQSSSGVTGKADTSFTNYSAYISTLKTHPGIKLVNGFHFSSVKEKKDVIYCKTGSRPLKLDIFYPEKRTQRARCAIIIIHGGGWRSGSRTQHYPLAQQLANLGYICFTPEYRLSTEALYPAAVYDIKASIRWVHENAKDYGIDTSQIALLGFSAGGELATFMGATNTIDKFEGNKCHPGSSSFAHAIVDIDGILAFIHPESGEGDDSKRISAATNWFGYSKTENAALWQEGSPLTHVNKYSPPILFINSGVDRMHAGREDYIKRLDQYHIYSEIKTFRGAPHPFCLFDPWFQPTVQYIDEFLKKVFSNK